MNTPYQQFTPKRLIESQFGEVAQVVQFRAMRSEFKNVNVLVPGRMHPRIASYLAYLHMVKNVLHKSNYDSSTIHVVCTYGSAIYAIDKSVIKGSVVDMNLFSEVRFVPKNPVADGEAIIISKEYVATTKIDEIFKGVVLTCIPYMGIQRDEFVRMRAELLLPVSPTRYQSPESVVDIDGIRYGRTTVEMSAQYIGVEDKQIWLEVHTEGNSLFEELISDPYIRSVVALQASKLLADRKKPVEFIFNPAEVELFPGTTCVNIKPKKVKF